MSEVKQVIEHVLIRKMWDRVALARSDSDTAYFFDLLYFGEFVLKLITLGLVSTLADDRERQRYTLLHALARQDGLGGWATALEEATSGPASQLQPGSAADLKRDVSQKFGPADGSWQFEAAVALTRCLNEFPGTAEGLPAKASLQTSARLFVHLRNRTRGHGAPSRSTLAAVVPDLERALLLLASNTKVLLQPWGQIRQNVSGKYNVAPIVGESAVLTNLKRESTHTYPDGIYLDVDGSIFLVPLVESDIDLSDCLVANGNFRAGRLEMLSYITNHIREGDGTAFVADPAAPPASETASLIEMDLVGNTFTNMPTRIPDYVRRPRLESELRSLLTDDRHSIITLVGRGGVGKTSLALNVLEDISEDGCFFSVIWFSSRDIDLRSNGPKKVRADVFNKEDMAGQYCQLMSPPGYQKKGFNQLDYLASGLRGGTEEQPILFVFDNFETTQDPQSTYDWIDSHIRLPNKALITSRFRGFRGDYPVEVRGMERTEFDQLVETTSIRVGLSAGALDQSMRDQLFDESDGHPYIVKILLGEFSRNSGRARKVERVLAARDDILDALFERTFTSLTTPAKRIFLTLCSWRSALIPRLAGVSWLADLGRVFPLLRGCFLTGGV